MLSPESGTVWRGVWLASAWHYGVAALLCAVFSAAYESLSHGVVSLWMVGLFAYPLVLGVLPSLVGGVAGLPASHLARQLRACAIMTLVAGSCLWGVLEIYGTTSGLVWPYPLVGSLLLVAAILVQVVHAARMG